MKPEEIFDQLKAVWDIALRRKSKVLALTVPEAGVRAYKERLDARRNKLNDLIKGYKREGLSVYTFMHGLPINVVRFSNDWNSHVFDLNAVIPYFAMSEGDRERYWDDAIHFTPDGYDLLGNKVGIALVNILAKERADAMPIPAKKRRVFRDDNKVFEEEVGNPTEIDQGYIVVRRQDLD